MILVQQKPQANKLNAFLKYVFELFRHEKIVSSVAVDTS